MFQDAADHLRVVKQGDRAQAAARSLPTCRAKSFSLTASPPRMPLPPALDIGGTGNVHSWTPGAGAGTLIMSLWSVEDKATRQWMKALYEARLLKRMDTAEAVRAASLSVLRDRRKRGKSTHPFYWGAFVAAGDWN